MQPISNNKMFKNVDGALHFWGGVQKEGCILKSYSVVNDFFNSSFKVHEGKKIYYVDRDELLSALELNRDSEDSHIECELMWRRIVGGFRAAHTIDMSNVENKINLIRYPLQQILDRADPSFAIEIYNRCLLTQHFRRKDQLMLSKEIARKNPLLFSEMIGVFKLQADELEGFGCLSLDGVELKARVAENLLRYGAAKLFPFDSTLGLPLHLQLELRKPITISYADPKMQELTLGLRKKIQEFIDNRPPPPTFDKMIEIWIEKIESLSPSEFRRWLEWKSGYFNEWGFKLIQGCLERVKLPDEVLSEYIVPSIVILKLNTEDCFELAKLVASKDNCSRALPNIADFTNFTQEQKLTLADLGSKNFSYRGCLDDVWRFLAGCPDRERFMAALLKREYFQKNRVPTKKLWKVVVEIRDLLPNHFSELMAAWFEVLGHSSRIELMKGLYYLREGHLFNMLERLARGAFGEKILPYVTGLSLEEFDVIEQILVNHSGD